MRSFIGYTAVALLLSSAGCSSKGPGALAVQSTQIAAPPSAFQAARPATVLYTTTSSSGRQVVAVAEDATGAATPLTAAGVDGVYVATLGARRVLVAELDSSGAIARLVAVGVDGTGRQIYAAFTNPAYSGTGKALASGDSVVIELRAEGATVGDVLALHAGAPPMVIAHNATLVAATAERAAVLVAGALQSVRLDGTGTIALGGGDGLDTVVEARGDRLLLTLHGTGKAASDVRLVSIDGSVRVTVGQPQIAETAFATTSDRIVYLRAAGAGPVLVSVAADGTDERVLTSVDLKAQPLWLLADGTTIFGSVSGALMSVPAQGGRPRILDAAAGENISVAMVAGDRVVYTGVNSDAMSLRAARLDGTGHATLCEKPFWMPYALALTPDGHVVFHRALAGQLEGGQVYSVALDGSDLRPLGTSVVDPSGSPRPDGPVDQDFEAVTPAGRVILEAEFEGQQGGSLLVAAPGSSMARQITAFSSIKFAALIPG